MRDDMDERRGDYAGPLDLPDSYDSDEADDRVSDGPSLIDEIGVLFEDGRTYAEAELAFQKSRAAFVADRAKGALVFGVGAAILLHIALIALAVGVVFALTPVVGAWGATAIVAGLLLAGTAYLVFKLKARVDAIAEAFSEDRN